MEFQKTEVTCPGVKVSIEENGQEIARGYLYTMKNELHEEPSLVGYIEDVFVAEEQRGKGHGIEITKALIEEARQQGCYKIILTSRYGRDKLHDWYKKLGFVEHGKEFRMDLS